MTLLRICVTILPSLFSLMKAQVIKLTKLVLTNLWCMVNILFGLNLWISQPTKYKKVYTPSNINDFTVSQNEDNYLIWIFPSKLKISYSFFWELLGFVGPRQLLVLAIYWAPLWYFSILVVPDIGSAVHWEVHNHCIHMICHLDSENVITHVNVNQSKQNITCI